jgi:hypothetical protein
MFKVLVKRFLILIFIMKSLIYSADNPEIYWIYLYDNISLNDASAMLESYGDVRVKSKALHAVSLKLNRFTNPALIETQPIVLNIEPVRLLKSIHKPEYKMTLEKSSQTVDPFYGYAFDQLSSLGIIDAHHLGYTGKGIKIGILDSGFKSSISVFDHIRNTGRLIAEWDFVNNDNNTEDQPEDSEPGYFHTHGTGVWSVIGAYEEGFFVGGAYDAEFVLAKTEVIPTETPVEEDYYVAAIEWFDSLNVDIATASLAYLEFDNPEDNYPLSALDGETTVVAKICNWAANRGMIIVNAMGNEGPGLSSLWSPADSPNVIAVGSVDSYGTVSNFSGRGPTFDGRIKPDVAALGETVYRISPNESIGASNGTSYATPLITSGIALIKQLKPFWDVHDILDLFRQYSNQPKNNQTGWGIPDFGQIIRDLKEKESEPIVVSAYPNPSNPGQGVTILTPRVNENQVLTVYNLIGQEIWNTTDIGLEDSICFYIPPLPLPSGIYMGRTGGQTVKFIKF